MRLLARSLWLLIFATACQQPAATPAPTVASAPPSAALATPPPRSPAPATAVPATPSPAVTAQAAAALTSDFTPPKGAATSAPDKESPAYFRILTATSKDGVTFMRTGQVVSDQANVPDMVVDAKGRILLYYTGWTLGDRTNASAVALSEDGGKTWIYKHLQYRGLSGAPAPVDPDVVLLPDGTFRMYLTTGLGGRPVIIYGEGTDGIAFDHKGTAFAAPSGPAIDSATFQLGSTWHMYAISAGSTAHYHATSADGRTFTLVGTVTFAFDGSQYFITNGHAADAGYRMLGFFIPKKHIRSFVTRDGATWRIEPGERLTFGAGGAVEGEYVKDGAIVRLPDSTYLLAYVTRIP